VLSGGGLGRLSGGLGRLNGSLKRKSKPEKIEAPNRKARGFKFAVRCFY
jgi:hypothetical protein